MKLSAKEMEGLIIYQAGYLAQKRLARGLKLNHPETIAIIASQIQELARDGHSVASLMDEGRQMLGRKQVMEGVGDIIHEIQVEATFPDGTKLVTVRYPICREQGDLKLALYGSFLPVPSLDIFEKSASSSAEHQDLLIAPPGSIYPAQEKEIEINQNRNKVALVVRSTCDRPIQVGSHYNFLEANRYLVFDRALAYGKRLNIPSGTAVRFEPGTSKTVTLVEIGGKRIVRGGNNLCDGPVNNVSLPAIMKKVIAEGFGHEAQLTTLQPTPCFMSRFLYARTYGPTVGDKIKLGDTTLVIEVEKDFTVYGDECKFGGGKVLREGMGQASMVSCNDVLDAVIINCVVVDSAQGIVKADVGIKDGKIIGIGKAGNNDVMDSVTPNMTVGACTDVIAGEGYILTAGGIDCHIHFICPQLAKHAISAGITTMIGGGTGPSTTSCCTTSAPGVIHIRSMIQSTDEFPLNFGFTGKGNTSRTDDLATELIEQIEAGAIGLKLHEDCGSTPAAIDCALNVAEAYDIQVMIHTDTLNESGCVEDTIKAFKGRTIHTYHTEGAGGGHAPDIISVCSEPNVIPSSTNPTRPYTCNTIDEHLDMLMVCHHLDKNLKEDIAFAESRIRAETIAAEDVLHDLGAISIMSSDSQAMGRVGEVIIRTWQTADKMRKQRGRLPEEKGLNDNFRVLRYISKYTINPAIAQGISRYVGSIELGKLADLVLWNPAFFGVKPHMILKGGQIAWAVMGNPNASIPTPEPVRYKKMFGAYGKSVGKNSYMFVSKLSLERGKVQSYGIEKEIVPISNVRNINKNDMKFNNFLPKLKVDSETYKVFMAKEQAETEMQDEDSWTELTCSPANSLPLAQRYFLF